jgi:pyruvate kinase
MAKRACTLAGRDGFAKSRERVIIIAGVPFGTPGATNMIRITVLDADSK